MLSPGIIKHMHVVADILLIAIVGAVLGLASIPFGFHLTTSPIVVYLGNAFGSLFAAIVLLYLSDKFVAKFFQKKIKQEKIERVSVFINKYGVHLYGLLCPLFPGVTVSVPAAIALKLNMRAFKIWLYMGLFLVSAGYVFGYWWTVVR